MNPVDLSVPRVTGAKVNARPKTMRRFVVASVVFHVFLFVGFSLSANTPVRPIISDPIYTVALVKDPVPNLLPPEPAKTPPKPKVETPPKPKPEPTPPPPKIEEAVVVPKKVEPKKDPVPIPKPKDPPKKQPDPKPKEKTPTPEPEAPKKQVDIPNAEVKPVSMGVVDQREFKNDYYLEAVRAVLARAWQTQKPSANGTYRTTVHFVIRRDGSIATPEIREQSGWAGFDRAALGTVLRAGQLPPLPQSYTGNELGLTVDFQQVTAP